MAALVEWIREAVDQTIAEGCTEEKMLSTANALASEVRRLHPDDTRYPITLKSFDRSEEFQVAPADYCLSGIEKLCTVRAWTFIRQERALFGLKRVRLLAMLGPAHNVELGHAVYDLVDEALSVETAAWQKIQKDANRAKNIIEHEIHLAHKLNDKLAKLATKEGPATVTRRTEILKKAIAGLPQDFNPILATLPGLKVTVSEKVQPT